MSEQAIVPTTSGAFGSYLFRAGQQQTVPPERNWEGLARSILTTIGLPELGTNVSTIETAISRVATQRQSLPTCEPATPNSILTEAFAALGVNSEERQTDLAYYVASRVQAELRFNQRVSSGAMH